MPGIAYEPGDEEQRAALDHLYGEMKGVEANTKPRIRKKRKPVDNKSKGKPGRRSPVIDYVRSLDKDYRTTHEVADALGISQGFLRKLARSDEVQAPSYVAPFGKTVVYLYTKEDIKELRKHMASRHKSVMSRQEYESKKKDDKDG